ARCLVHGVGHPQWACRPLQRELYGLTIRSWAGVEASNLLSWLDLGLIEVRGPGMGLPAVGSTAIHRLARSDLGRRPWRVLASGQSGSNRYSASRGVTGRAPLIKLFP